MTHQIVSDLIDDDELFEMANFGPARTGLRFTVWFSGDPVGKHNRPRGKVRIEGTFYSFSLDVPFAWLAGQPPGVSSRDTRKLEEFVRLNQEALLAYWNGGIDTGDLVERLRPV